MQAIGDSIFTGAYQIALPIFDLLLHLTMAGLYLVSHPTVIQADCHQRVYSWCTVLILHLWNSVCSITCSQYHVCHITFDRYCSGVFIDIISETFKWIFRMYWDFGKRGSLDSSLHTSHLLHLLFAESDYATFNIELQITGNYWKH